MQPNTSSVVNFLSKSAANFATTIATPGLTVAGATTVPLDNTSVYSQGDTVVLTVNPSAPTKGVFTGQINGKNVINVKWVSGTPGPFAAGTTVVDFITAAHWDMAMTGMLKEHKQSGSHSNINADSLTVAGTASFPAKSIAGSALADKSVGFATLLDNIFGGAVQTYTPTVVDTQHLTYNNGTGSYVNLGGIKLCWGRLNISSSDNSPTGRVGGVSLPSNFFSTTVQPFMFLTVESVGNYPYQHVAGDGIQIALPRFNFYVDGAGSGAGLGVVFLFIGT